MLKKRLTRLLLIKQAKIIFSVDFIYIELFTRII